MTIYIIIALSFAIMYSYKYTREIVLITQRFVNSLDVTWGDFSPIKYSIKEFLYHFIMCPITATKIFKGEDIIKKEVSYILENNYGLEAEK